MPDRIPFSLFIKVLTQGIRKVDPGLVCQTDENEEHISKFVGKVILCRFRICRVFKRLLSVHTGHEAGDFSRLLHQDSRIG